LCHLELLRKCYLNQKSINIAYAYDQYHPRPTLSQSSEFKECQSNFDNTSDSTSFDRKQRKKIKFDDKLKFYSFDELHEGYIFGQSFGFEVSIIIF
jgi:hypothetical protein